MGLFCVAHNASPVHHILPPAHEEIERHHAGEWSLGEVTHHQSDVLLLDFIRVKQPVGVSGNEKKGSWDLIGGWIEKMFYLMTHSTHFIYGYMASEIW